MVWANDAFANATLISGASGSITPVHYDGVTDPATSETGEAVYGNGETLWWKWVAPSSGTFQFSTEGSPSDDGDSHGLDTKLQILTSISAVVAQNDDATSGTYNSRVQFTATGGTTYYIQVDQYGAGQAGTIHLAWLYIPPTPTASTWTSSGTYSPLVAFPGDDLTVTGTHLDVVTDVTVGGVAQSFTDVSPTSLLVHIDSSAVSGPVIVSNVSGSAHPTHSGSDLTVRYPGPWIQPPDEPASSNAIGLAVYGPNGPPYPTGATEPDFAGSPAQTVNPAANFLTFEVQAISPQPSPDWRWDALLPLMVLYPPSSYDMPAYDASGDVTGTPHAIDYQTETGVGSVPTSDLTLTYEIDAQGAQYNEDTDNRTLAEDLWQEHIQFRRIPDTDWDSSGFVAGAWPSQAYLAGLSVDHDGSFVNPGATLSLSSSGSWTDNNATLLNGSPAYVDPQDVTLADLAAGRAWAITLTTFTGASSIAAPYIDPSTTFGVGGAQSKAVEPVYGRIHSAWTYRPPRYRLLYDTPPTTAVRTLRRRQQAAPVGSAPRRRQIANRAGSLRRGPGAAP